MAFIKGLDIIAVTDHNTSGHAAVIEKLASKLGILAIPGMEVQTREEVHVLCYFPSVDKLNKFDNLLTKNKASIINNRKIFGDQTIRNEHDEVIGEIDIALIMSVDVDLDSMFDMVTAFDGVMVPAHVNKSSNSILANLGFIPPDMPIQCIEIYEKAPVNDRLLGQYRRLYNSDAHYLEAISEPVNFVNLKEKTAIALIDYLSGKDGI
jgi:PHP family Zn ribbon phosphoesterase